MPETIVLDPEDLVGIDRFIERKRKVVLKRRIGRDEGDLEVISEPSALWKLNLISHHYLLQEYVEGKIDGYRLFIRSVAFGGEFMCMVANLSPRSSPGDAISTFISSGNPFGLSERNFKTESFSQKSWELRYGQVKTNLKIEHMLWRWEKRRLCFQSHFQEGSKSFL